MVFPVVRYGCESWTVKKAEHRRIDAFELWCWRRLLIVPWTARRSNQPILKKGSPRISLEGMMLKLKLQYFGHLMRSVDSLENTLMLGGRAAGGEGDNRGWHGWMASLTRWTWVWVNSGHWWWTARPGMLRFMGLQSQTRLSESTELKWICKGREEAHCGYFAPTGKVSWIPASQNTTIAIKTHVKNQQLKGKFDTFYNNFGWVNTLLYSRGIMHF